MTQHILMVEDDIHGQEITKSVLEHSGFSVDVAANAEQALEMLQTNTYQVAIIDLSLPHLSGWDLLEAISAQFPTRELPCIAITAFHSSKVAREALEAGFIAYFSKPIQIEHFVDQVKEILANFNAG